MRRMNPYARRKIAKRIFDGRIVIMGAIIVRWSDMRVHLFQCDAAPRAKRARCSRCLRLPVLAATPGNESECGKATAHQRHACRFGYNLSWEARPCWSSRNCEQTRHGQNCAHEILHENVNQSRKRALYCYNALGKSASVTLLAPPQPGCCNQRFMSGFASKKPVGTSLNPATWTGITGQSSGRGRCVIPMTYQSTTSVSATDALRPVKLGSPSPPRL